MVAVALYMDLPIKYMKTAIFLNIYPNNT